MTPSAASLIYKPDLFEASCTGAVLMAAISEVFVYVDGHMVWHLCVKQCPLCESLFPLFILATSVFGVLTAIMLIKFTASKINHISSMSTFLGALNNNHTASRNLNKHFTNFPQSRALNMAPKRSSTKTEQEDEYKAVRDAKDAQYGSRKIPVCKSCYEGHLRCPGPEIGTNGDWDFSRKCGRCVDGGDNMDCDFEAEMTRL
jgi:hypothetical protein